PDGRARARLQHLAHQRLAVGRSALERGTQVQIEPGEQLACVRIERRGRTGQHAEPCIGHPPERRIALARGRGAHRRDGARHQPRPHRRRGIAHRLQQSLLEGGSHSRNRRIAGPGRRGRGRALAATHV
ncbi:MAG: hypothetical protein ACK56I_34385, partial [bacterium]